MNNETTAHNIASIASKLYFTNDDILKYKIDFNGYTKFVDDLTNKYTEAYNQVIKNLPNL